MKKYLILSLVAVLPFLSFTQDLVIKGTKAVTKQYTPQQVIDSLQKTFPNAQSVKYYKGDAEATKKGWAVSTEDNLGGAGVDYYTISFKQEGTLLEYKIEQKMDQLPEKVVTSLKSLSKDYPGYKVVSKNFFMMKDNNKSKEYYQITAKKDKEKKDFFYSPEGELIKIK